MALSAATLSSFTNEISTITIGPSSATLSSLDNIVELHLQRIDEASSLIEDVRKEIQETSDTAFPILLRNANELTALFGVLDRAEESVNKGYAAAKAAEEKMGQLQAAYDQRYPEAMAKLIGGLGGMSMFGFGNKNANKAAAAQDAPVKLPPFDMNAMQLDSASEISALTSLIGVANAADISALASRDGNENE